MSKKAVSSELTEDNGRRKFVAPPPNKVEKNDEFPAVSFAFLNIFQIYHRNRFLTKN